MIWWVGGWVTCLCNVLSVLGGRSYPMNHTQSIRFHPVIHVSQDECMVVFEVEVEAFFCIRQAKAAEEEVSVFIPSLEAGFPSTVRSKMSGDEREGAV